jgi:hypothetical protein
LALAKLSTCPPPQTAVVITNQVQSDPAGGMTFVQDPKKPVGCGAKGGCVRFCSFSLLFRVVFVWLLQTSQRFTHSIGSPQPPSPAATCSRTRRRSASTCARARASSVSSRSSTRRASVRVGPGGGVDVGGRGGLFCLRGRGTVYVSHLRLLSSRAFVTRSHKQQPHPPPHTQTTAAQPRARRRLRCPRRASSTTRSDP